MPSKCSNFGKLPLLSIRSRSQVLSYILAGWLIYFLGSMSVAQDFSRPSKVIPSPQGTDRTSFRPSIPELKSSKPAKAIGFTFVGLEPGLGKMLKGEEPRNQIELISLEKQQTKVAEKVNLVTVNLQHGSTQGSGVIITGDGYILTAAHVAGRKNQKIKIVMHDGTRIEGITMGANRNMDAGLVRIITARNTATDPWPHASLGASADLQPGQWVIATGHPGGWMHDRPAVVRIGRVLRMLPSTLVTDCSLIGGDSGGPLFDLQGRLVGVHSRIGVDVDDNMHVPVDVFDDSWSRMVKGDEWGSLPGFKPAIGVLGSSDQEAEKNCKISRVEPKGPADKAGIRAGDVILKFDEQPIQNFDDLKLAVDSLTPGEQVSVELQRDGKHMSLRLIVGVRE